MTFCHSHPPGVLRREFLQVGFSGYLRLGLAELLAGRALAEEVSRRRNRAEPRPGPGCGPGR
jgi:hypothetical protein